MAYFTKSRNIELSTIYYLETQINANWTNITTVKSFTNAYKVDLPVVCIRGIDLDPLPKEIGATTQNMEVSIAIDIFSTSDGQKIDLAHFITDKLKDPWSYYEHSQTPGSPETLTRVENGKIKTKDFLNNTNIDLGIEGVDRYDLHRWSIIIKVKKD